MRKIEFLEQTQKIILGFHEIERRGKKKEKDSKLVKIVF